MKMTTKFKTRWKRFKHPMLGKKHTKETKEKIRKTRIGKYQGKDNPNWKGGKIIVDGYKYIYEPNHPNSTKDGYVCEHRLIIEKKIGRYLVKGEIVHHINGIKTDNRIKNLILMTNSQHAFFHGKEKVANGTFHYPNGKKNII